MRKDQLSSRIHTLREQTGASFNTILTLYFLESILRRISLSKEQDVFILKGGFLLSSSLGIRLRTTKDIDLEVQGVNLEPMAIARVFENILRLELDDQIQYEILGFEPIREKEPYGGLRCKILCKLENIKQTVAIDIATGDPITPGAERYSYRTLFDQESLSILAFNLETILAEKFQTIAYRGLANSRSKDFYDLYVIVKLKGDQIDRQTLRAAFETTFTHRSTPVDFDRFSQLLLTLKDDPLTQTRWNAFAKQNPYASEIKFDDTIQACNVLLELVKNAS